MGRKIRVLGISVNIIDLLEDGRLYQYALTPPSQNIGLVIDTIFETAIENLDNGQTLKAPPKNLPQPDPVPLVKENINYPSIPLLGQVGGYSNRSIREKLDFRSDNSIMNIDPIGKWNIRVQNISADNILRAYGLSRINDIVLTFRIGVRDTETFEALL